MQREQTWFWLAILLGLAVRVGLGIIQPEDFQADNDGYLAHARPVAAGEGFLGPSSHRPTAFRPPAYPIALGLFMRCGLSESASVAALNAVASVLILLLTWKLAVQLCLPSTFVLLSILAVAFDPLLLRYSTLPMTEVPCAAVLLAAVICFRAAIKADRTSVAVRSVILAGMLFALGTLIRPVVLVSCTFLTLHAVVCQVCQRRQSDLRQLAFRILFVLLPLTCAVVGLTPWIVRNAIQFQRFIPATTHGGYTLALGNNVDFYRDVINGPDQFPWDGTALDVWQRRMNGDSEKEGVTPGDEPATDAWYYQKATETIRNDPASFLKATLLRLRRFWALSTAADEQTSRTISAAVGIWYAALWFGLAIHLISGLLSRNTKQFVWPADLWLVVLSFMLMHSVYWTDTRMRAPLMPILCVLSLSGWRLASNAAAIRMNSIARTET